MKPFQSYNKGNWKPFIMKGRVFFAHILTTFKKLNPYTAKTLNTAKTQRIYLCDHKIFAPLRKFLRPCLAGRQVCGVSGQSVIEYFIILAVVVAITALSVSVFLNKGRESGEIIFNKAVSRISEEGAGPIAPCDCGGICTDHAYRTCYVSCEARNYQLCDQEVAFTKCSFQCQDPWSLDCENCKRPWRTMCLTDRCSPFGEAVDPLYLECVDTEKGRCLSDCEVNPENWGCEA